MIGKLHRARLIQAAVLALAVLAAAGPADEMLHDFVFRHFVSHEVRMLANGLTLLGATEVATVGLIGLAVVGYRTADAPMWQAAVGGVAGVLLGGLTTQVAKHIACRARPRLVDGWGVGRGHAARLAGASRVLPLAVFRRIELPRLPLGPCRDRVRDRGRADRMGPPRRRGWLLAVASAVAASRIVSTRTSSRTSSGGGLFGWWSGEAGLLLVARYVAPRWRARNTGTAPRSRAAA